MAGGVENLSIIAFFSRCDDGKSKKKIKVDTKEFQRKEEQKENRIYVPEQDRTLSETFLYLSGADPGKNVTGFQKGDRRRREPARGVRKF